MVLVKLLRASHKGKSKEDTRKAPVRVFVDGRPMPKLRGNHFDARYKQKGPHRQPIEDDVDQGRVLQLVASELLDQKHPQDGPEGRQGRVDQEDGEGQGPARHVCIHHTRSQGNRLDPLVQQERSQEGGQVRARGHPETLQEGMQGQRRHKGNRRHCRGCLRDAVHLASPA